MSKQNKELQRLDGVGKPEPQHDEELKDGTDTATGATNPDIKTVPEQEKEIEDIRRTAKAPTKVRRFVEASDEQNGN